jgi:hypothetical protein
MNLADELEIRRINAALPFADPIGVVHKWGDLEVTIVAGSWRAEARIKRVAKRRRRLLDKMTAQSQRWGLYDDDF